MKRLILIVAALAFAGPAVAADLPVKDWLHSCEDCEL